MKTLFKKLIILVTFISMGSLQVNAQEAENLPIKDLITDIDFSGAEPSYRQQFIDILELFPKDAIGSYSMKKRMYIYVTVDSCQYMLSDLEVTCVYKDGIISGAKLADGKNSISFDTTFDEDMKLKDEKVPNPENSPYIFFSDGKWARKQIGAGCALCYIPGANTPSEIIKKLFTSRTLPKLQLVDEEVNAFDVFKGTEKVGEMLSDKRKAYLAKLEQYEKDKEAEAQKQKEAEKALYQELCQNYGKKYVDACQRGQLIIGTPEELFALVVFSGAMKRVNNATLSSETGRKKTYKLYGPTVYNTSSRTTFTNGFVGWATFTNGKLTSISWR